MERAASKQSRILLHLSFFSRMLKVLVGIGFGFGNWTWIWNWVLDLG